VRNEQKNIGPFEMHRLCYQTCLGMWWMVSSLQMFSASPCILHFIIHLNIFPFRRVSYDSWVYILQEISFLQSAFLSLFISLSLLLFFAFNYLWHDSQVRNSCSISSLLCHEAEHTLCYLYLSSLYVCFFILSFFLFFLIFRLVL
jgi:hypothetical protein